MNRFDIIGRDLDVRHRNPDTEANLSQIETPTIVDVIVVAATERYIKVRKYGTLREAVVPLAHTEIIGVENSDAYRMILPAFAAHRYRLL